MQQTHLLGQFSTSLLQNILWSFVQEGCLICPVDFSIAFFRVYRKNAIAIPKNHNHQLFDWLTLNIGCGSSSCRFHSIDLLLERVP